ncbi:transcription initiation factor IIB [Methanobrevibacter thaueri]|uniref:Transcription initiation factor IIB n=1 Tax=Methanobrevibacter thaueri TaxID=190975 RepID=A0A315XP25_9EURY|nr:transcription initiation factor IIB [Methanobrevibacter thaueri]
MTAQTPEKLILNGKRRLMQSCPPLIDDPNIITVLSREEFKEFKKELHDEYKKKLRKGSQTIPSPIGSTACWRNYIGTWEIKDGKFYLKDLEGRMRMTKKEPVHATWFSGVLKVPEGKVLQYVHLGFETLYEKEIHITIENGIVMGQTIIDNRRSIEGYKVKSRKIAHELGLSEKAQFKAVKIIEEASNNGLTSGRNPAGVAAAAVYIASVLLGERKTQRDVAEIAGVSEITIRNSYKELTELLETSINVQL